MTQDVDSEFIIMPLFELLSRLPESSEQFAWLNRTHREL